MNFQYMWLNKVVSVLLCERFRKSKLVLHGPIYICALILIEKKYFFTRDHDKY